ncbi:hypothetical protein OG625_38680 [Streptomyces sp. NBC_01351]|uniref:hypothetical protein n=1 Tax=Streptomyces sp. NBC_01351 TaxID=2903833 RepID=UPI002E36472B|nr:hypothetical protein [Streptomyces sp. NBC_01351]
MLRRPYDLLADLLGKPLREAVLVTITVASSNVDEDRVRVGVDIESAIGAVEQERDLGVVRLTSGCVSDN